MLGSVKVCPKERLYSEVTCLKDSDGLSESLFDLKLQSQCALKFVKAERIQLNHEHNFAFTPKFSTNNGPYLLNGTLSADILL